MCVTSPTRQAAMQKHMTTSSEIEPLAQNERRILGFCISKSGYVEETKVNIQN